MRIVIARHGKTNENQEGKLSGNSNHAQLIEEGLEHAKHLAGIFANEKFDAIFSSSLDRAVDTAKPIENILGLKIQKTDNLNEFDFGELDGKKDEGEALLALKKRREDLNFKFPKGESYNDVMARVKSFLNELLKKDFRKILIISHGGVNRSLMYLLSGKKEISLDNINTPNKIVYEFDTLAKKCKWINTETRETGEGFLFRENF